MRIFHREQSSSEPTTVRLSVLEWIIASSTVALGLALFVAPIAFIPRLVSLYSVLGALENTSFLSRLMLSWWFPPVIAALPMTLSVYSTVTYMKPQYRRIVLWLSLFFVLLALVFFFLGLLTPLLSVAKNEAVRFYCLSLDVFFYGQLEGLAFEHFRP